MSQTLNTKAGEIPLAVGSAIARLADLLPFDQARFPKELRPNVRLTQAHIELFVEAAKALGISLQHPVENTPPLKEESGPSRLTAELEAQIQKLREENQLLHQKLQESNGKTKAEIADARRQLETEQSQLKERDRLLKEAEESVRVMVTNALEASEKLQVRAARLEEIRTELLRVLVKLPEQQRAEFAASLGKKIVAEE